jgi:DNA-binding XRE family transcriptional regulator
LVIKGRDRKKAPRPSFGQSLRGLRLERNWSQEQLAEAASVTLNYVGNLERGEGPSLHILIRLGWRSRPTSRLCSAISAEWRFEDLPSNEESR